MKELFKTLRGRCAAVDVIRMADRDRGQIDKYEQRPAVSFPCALIKLVFTSCETLSGKTQLCTGIATVRVADNKAMQETSSLAPDEASERSLDYYGIANAVYAALQAECDEVITNFDRLTYGDEDRQDGLDVIKMTFGFTYLDRSAEQ